MGFFDAVQRFLALEPLQERSVDPFTPAPDMATQIAQIHANQAQARPWRIASITEALGVPAIFGAVNMVANLVGSMSMRAFRGEVELSPDQRPRVIVRPDPFSIPREFYRGTTYNLASRGEAWWWVAKRDGDGLALSVLNVPPHEVTVEEDPRDLRYPIIRWRDKRMRNEDFRQLVYAREPGSLRGVGPLQMCGAAVSVSVEAQEWAANFFAGGGGIGSVELHSEVEIDETEAAALKGQWIATPSNMPKVTNPSLTVKEFGVNTQAAGMLDSRDYQVGEVARMFNIPGSLLDYAVAGSSLTYQNVGSEFENLLRRCLRPNYLEVIEQTMSDFLIRSIVSRFNTDSLTLADIKTRYDVYGVGITNGIIDAQEARRFEGLAPGDVENAAVPFSVPAAIPGRLPIQMRDAEVRCDGRRLLRGRIVPCNRLLAERAPFSGTCPRCKKAYTVAVA